MWNCFTPVVNVDTLKETGFIIKTTINNTAGPCGVVRVQTVDTVQLYKSDSLRSASFSPPPPPPQKVEREIQTDSECMDVCHEASQCSSPKSSILSTSSSSQCCPSKSRAKKRVRFKDCQLNDESDSDSQEIRGFSSVL